MPCSWMFAITEARPLTAPQQRECDPLALLALAMITGAASAQQRTDHRRLNHDNLRCERPQHWTVHVKPLTCMMTAPR